MNKERRTKIEKLIAEIEAVKDDEQAAYDNLPESIQQGETGDKMQAAIDALENAESSMQEAADA